MTGPGGLEMTLCPYNSDELHDIHSMLENLIDEAKLLVPNMDVDDIIERLFDLADHGERDPTRLRAAVLRHTI
jgi:hypothetical protein